MLFTGNSFELLGSKITEDDGKVLEGIGLKDFETKVSYKSATRAIAFAHANSSRNHLSAL